MVFEKISLPHVYCSRPTQNLEAPKMWPPPGGLTKAYSKYPTSQLLFSCAIFKACSWNWLAVVTPTLLQCANRLSLERISFWLIKNTIFTQFCGGETIEDTRKKMRDLEARNINVILDYAAETAFNPKQFYSPNLQSPISSKKQDIAASNIMSAIEMAENHVNPMVAVKISALFDNSLLENLNRELDIKICSLKLLKNDGWDRLISICNLARNKNVKIAFDAEQSLIQKSIDFLAIEMMKLFNKIDDVPDPAIFTTYQMYRKDGLIRLKQDLEESKSNGYHFGVKIVRGAYIKGEKIWSMEKGYECPIYETIEETHTQFNQCVAYVLNSAIFPKKWKLSVIFATHNFESLRLATQIYIENRCHREENLCVSFAHLYGMCDAVTNTLVDSGYKVYKYLPFGPVQDVIPYLIRRALENSSIFNLSQSDANLMWKELVYRFTPRFLL